MAFEGIANAAGKLYGQVIKIPQPPTESDLLVASIKKAHSELKRAEALFNEVTNSEMVDCISYDILSARAKYSYLLRLAKEKNIRV